MSEKSQHHALQYVAVAQPNLSKQICLQRVTREFHKKKISDVSSHTNTSQVSAVTYSMDLCWMCAGVDSHGCSVCSGTGTQARCGWAAAVHDPFRTTTSFFSGKCLRGNQVPDEKPLQGRLSNKVGDSDLSWLRVSPQIVLWLTPPL